VNSSTLSSALMLGGVVAIGLWVAKVLTVKQALIFGGASLALGFALQPSAPAGATT
jgi:hypothetical protein